MAAVITPEDPASPDATALITELDGHLEPLYPRESAAIHLYEQVGFRRIPPFGDYRDDPVSRCYEKRLQ